METEIEHPKVVRDTLAYVEKHGPPGAQPECLREWCGINCVMQWSFGESSVKVRFRYYGAAVEFKTPGSWIEEKEFDAFQPWEFINHLTKALWSAHAANEAALAAGWKSGDGDQWGA